MTNHWIWMRVDSSFSFSNKEQFAFVYRAFAISHDVRAKNTDNETRKTGLRSYYYYYRTIYLAPVIKSFVCSHSTPLYLFLLILICRLLRNASINLHLSFVDVRKVCKNRVSFLCLRHSQSTFALRMKAFHPKKLLFRAFSNSM